MGRLLHQSMGRGDGDYAIPVDGLGGLGTHCFSVEEEAVSQLL